MMISAAATYSWYCRAIADETAFVCPPGILVLRFATGDRLATAAASR